MLFRASFFIDDSGTDLPVDKQSYQNIKRPTAEAVARRCSVKKVLLKILQNSQEETCKIDLKINFRMNLKIDSSTVVFSCKSCEIFKNTYFVEHRQTAASAIDIDAKCSHPGQ